MGAPVRSRSVREPWIRGRGEEAEIGVEVGGVEEVSMRVEVEDSGVSGLLGEEEELMLALEKSEVMDVASPEEDGGTPATVTTFTPVVSRDREGMKSVVEPSCEETTARSGWLSAQAQSSWVPVL